MESKNMHACKISHRKPKINSEIQNQVLEWQQNHLVASETSGAAGVAAS